MSRKTWDAYFIDIAHAVATRATCDRKHVGAVIVQGRRIIATGYNGSIPGAAHCDDAGHDMANQHCKHCGVALEPKTVNEKCREVSGGIAPHEAIGGNCVRTVHAEANAIAQAARFGLSLDGSTLYCNTFPCWPCFKLIALAGITRIVYDDEYREDPRVRVGAGDAVIQIDRFLRAR